jgi:hypothetical protein
MSAYHQMGHDSENLLWTEDLAKYRGAILSPVNYDQAKVTGPEDRTHVLAARSNHRGDRSAPRANGGHPRPERFRQSAGSCHQSVGDVSPRRVSMRLEAPLEVFRHFHFRIR